MVTPTEVVLIRDGKIVKTDPITITLNQLDGIAFSRIWVGLSGGDGRIAQFRWGVRPGAKPELIALYRLINNAQQALAIPLTDLSFDFQTLQGSVQHGKSSDPQTIHVTPDQMKVFTFKEKTELSAWLKSHQARFTE